MDIKFWKDRGKKQLEPELFASMAEHMAKEIAAEGKKETNKPSQIRKFFDEVKRFDAMLKKDPAEFNNRLPYLKMLGAKAAYARGRKLISTGFKDFITDSLKQIKDKDDFYAFAGFFEAFIGYYKFYRPAEGGER